MSANSTYVSDKLAEAAAEFEANRVWSGERAAQMAISLVDEGADTGNFSLADALEVRSQISELYLKAGLYKQVAELDDEIEWCLYALSDGGYQEGFAEQIRGRREVMQEEEEEEEESPTRMPLRANTYPPYTESLPQKIPAVLTNETEPIPHRIYGRTFPQLPSDIGKAPLVSDPIEVHADEVQESDEEIQPSLPPGSQSDDNLHHCIHYIHHNEVELTNTFLGINLDTPEGRADEFFHRLSKWTHSFICGERNMFQKTLDKKVRVAILDTGFAYRTPKTSSFDAKVRKKMSFLKDDTDGNVDQVGHGTNVIYQVSRVSPNAILYSCRVTKTLDANQSVVEADSAAVVRALEWATGKDEDGSLERRVDIINMSFGWEHEDASVENALQAAQNAGILLFASVSNFGVLGENDVLYPARSKYVIAVDAADGMGHPTTFNSSSMDANSHRIQRFSAPGYKVLGAGGVRVDGTSYASPIAAGIAALILEFAQQTPLKADELVTKYLRKREGMVKIFKLMYKQKTAEVFMFLKPWRLLRDPKHTYGGDGGPKSKRFSVARRIIEALEEEYGYKIGIGDAIL